MSNSPEERMPLLLSQQQQQQQQPPSKQQGPFSKRQPKQRTTATTTPSTTTLTTTTVVQVDFPVFTDAGPSLDLSKVSNNLGSYSKKSGGGGVAATTTTTRLPEDVEEVVPTSSISSNNDDAAMLQIPHHQLLFRHDSEFSVGSDYQAPSSTWGRKQQGPSSNLASFAKAAAAAFHQGTKTPTNTLSGGSTLSSWYDPLSQSHRVPITGGSEDHQVEPTTTTTTHHGLPLLSVWQGSLLLTADCLGTGLLALPANVRVSLGLTVGLGFLVVSAPINWYAGYLLAQSATIVERRQHAANRIFASALLQQQQQQQIQQSLESQSDTISSNMATMGGSTTKSLVLVTIESTYGTKTRSALFTPLTTVSVGAATTTTTRAPEDDDGGGTVGTAHSRHRHRPRQHAQLHHDTATFDFIGMTQALFRNKHGTRVVMLLYYGNIFLVLGNYILVMSHAVMATVGEGALCTPVAGLIASVLMYAVSQSRSMARLGRAASVVSLAALFVVICQCLHAARVTQLRQEEQAGAEPAIAATTTMPLWVPAESSTSIIANFNSTNATTAVASASLQPTALWPTTSSSSSSSSSWLQDIAAAAATATTVSEPSTPSHDDSDNNNDNNRSSSSDNGASMHDIFRQLSALGSIGFAMGSQKLFLNIRHELADRSTAPRVLGISLTIFTSLYIVIILLAGPNPPAFLFDAIHGYWNRRLAGLLLWMHVVVSYAINSQAICSSMDRLFWHRLFQHFGATVRKTKSSADDDEDDDDDDDDDSNNNNRGMSPETLATVRWMSLTAALGVTAYTVANAIPFFQDLVALIGAVTVVPLTLLLPALYWRKELQVPLWTVSGWWKPDSSVDWPSYGLIVFSLVFMVTATAGVFDSISQDWENHGGRSFECIK
ncbi:hypothetical protein ACA910_010138 [Epithemia clementina (nom. ined.)]